MIIVMRSTATQVDIDQVVERISQHGLKPHISTGVERTIIGAIGDERILRKGIIVRSMEVYGLPTHIRVTIGTPQENARALKSLGDVLDEVEAAVRSSDSTGGRSDQ